MRTGTGAGTDAVTPKNIQNSCFRTRSRSARRGRSRSRSREARRLEKEREMEAGLAGIGLRIWCETDRFRWRKSVGRKRRRQMAAGLALQQSGGQFQRRVLSTGKQL